MRLKLLALTGAALCCIGGLSFLVVSGSYVVSFLNAPGENELLEGAAIALPFSFTCWALLCWLALVFRPQLPKGMVRAAAVPLFIVGAIFVGWFVVGVASDAISRLVS